jgi:hypothetical protein
MNPVDIYLKEIEKLVGGAAYTAYDMVLKNAHLIKKMFSLKSNFCGIFISTLETFQ